MPIQILSFLFGFLEASCFFIVPDVLLSLLAVQSYTRAFIATLYTLLGAIIGGSLIYFLSVHDSTTVITLFNYIPGINSAIQAVVEKQMEQSGILSLFMGSLQGLPYKLYACYAAILKIPYPSFIFVSIFARLARFLCVTTFVYLVSSLLKNYLSNKAIVAITIAGWTLFYIAYFKFGPLV